MKQEIIQQGAEAILVKKGKEVRKKRIKKGYRIKEIDEKLRKSRTKREAKLLKKIKGIIPVPKVKDIDEKNMEIIMEYINGKKLSESLDKIRDWKFICQEIGKNIAKLHEKDVIHSDLTTSNMIYIKKEKKVYFIDFGLSFTSSRIEDKAVDLHLIKQALEAKHYKKWEDYFKFILKGYKISKDYGEILDRLKLAFLAIVFVVQSHILLILYKI